MVLKDRYKEDAIKNIKEYIDKEFGYLTESYHFERGQDPKEAMQIGHQLERKKKLVIKIIKELANEHKVDAYKWKRTVYFAYDEIYAAYAFDIADLTYVIFIAGAKDDTTEYYVAQYSNHFKNEYELIDFDPCDEITTCATRIRNWITNEIERLDDNI